MSRGRWTYHRTYKTGCCGGPGCIMMLLSVPILPLLCGFAVIKDKVPTKEQTVEVSEMKNDESAMSINVDLGEEL